LGFKIFVDKIIFMKVLCIDDKIRPGDYSATPQVVEGCVYNTTCTCNGYGVDKSVVLSYKLEEFDQKYCWDCDRFIPLSDISETEMERNYKVSQPMEVGN
jgi:hypothetical protein